MSQRILIIAPSFPISDDRIIATWALKQANALRRRGVEVEVISPSPYVPTIIGDLLDYEHWSELEYQRTFDGLKVFYPRVPVYDIGGARRLYNRIPWLETQPLWRFSRQTVKKRVNSFNPDALLCHHTIPGGYLGMKTLAAFDIPYVTIEHSLTDVERTSENVRRLKLYTRVAQSSAACITVSQMMEGKIEELISRDIDIDVIYNGYDPGEVEFYESKATETETGNSFHLLSVGSFVERKGHKHLIKAFAQLNDRIETKIHCTLVGSGPLENNLKELASVYGVEDSIKFYSGLDRLELNQLMATADFFALPSWNEPFGVVYPEVMAHGVPVLLCKDQGFSELIENEKTGFLVPPRDATAIRETLFKVINDNSLAQQVGIRGQRLVQSKLTWDHNARRIQEAISQNI